MSDGDDRATIIPFPPGGRRGRLERAGSADRCEGLIHVFRTLPGRCECGENRWGGSGATADLEFPLKFTTDNATA